jgi:hypothetical protein
MADYKNIKGFNIQYLDSDPPNPIEGQMWFNSTSQTLKGAEVGGAPSRNLVIRWWRFKYCYKFSKYRSRNTNSGTEYLEDQ